MTIIRVVVVDDHAILREGIRSLLERHGEIHVVGEAENGREALVMVGQLLPDVVLMDLSMPLMDGLEATRCIKERYPAVKVLILTQHDSREYVTSVLQAGGSGYVLKRSGTREIVTAIHQVVEHGVFFQPEVIQQVVQHYREGSREDAGVPTRLTNRELVVLRMVVEGKSNKEIARLLTISPKTVSVHRTNIMSKLGVQNSADLVRYVLQNRLVEFPSGQ